MGKPEWEGLVVAFVVAAVYSIGGRRAYGLDASVTVHRFVATNSLLDPVTRQFIYNNHVLFSLADHVVYSLSHSADERVLRIVPIAASGLGVGVLTTVTARRLGLLPGVAAAVVAASSPLLVVQGREVRGYSLLVLCCVISTLLFSRLRRSSRPSRMMVFAYLAALAVGIGVHLYGLAMPAVHAAMAGPRAATSRRWLLRWISGVILGLASYVGVAGVMLHLHRGRLFRPDFPATLATTLLGGTRLTVALLALPLAVAAVALRQHRIAARGAAGAVALVVIAWLVAPLDLYPRFFIWLVPAVAYAVAVGISRHKWLAVILPALVVVQAVRFGPNFRRSDMANREAARIAREVARTGRASCIFGGLSAYGMEAYDSSVEIVGAAPHPPACEVIFQLTPGNPTGDGGIPVGWRSTFRYRRVLRAIGPGIALARRYADLESANKG